MLGKISSQLYCSNNMPCTFKEYKVHDYMYINGFELTIRWKKVDRFWIDVSYRDSKYRL